MAKIGQNKFVDVTNLSRLLPSRARPLVRVTVGLFVSKKPSRRTAALTHRASAASSRPHFSLKTHFYCSIVFSTFTINHIILCSYCLMVGSAQFASALTFEGTFSLRAALGSSVIAAKSTAQR